MKRIFVLVGLLIVTTVMPLWAVETPQVKEVATVGFGEMVEGDVGQARQGAILSALKEAVRISLLELMPASMVEENAIALDMEIFNRVTQYVQTFRIVSETDKADGHEVLLQTKIDLHKLRSALLAIGLLKEGTPREEVVRIQLILIEVSRYPWYREFEDFLRQGLDFVREVRLRSVMAGEFTMDIELVGDIQSLLDALTGKEFEGFFLEISQDFEDRVMVRLRSRETSGSSSPARSL